MGYVITLLSMILTAMPARAEDEFGRFFTTPAQRTQLDTLRRSVPEVAIEIDDTLLDTNAAAAEPAAPLDAVTLKGVVRRSDGANTAWINESNTNEGNLAAQDIRVPESSIGDNRAELRIGERRAPITLKVGETYDPAADAVINKTPVPDRK